MSGVNHGGSMVSAVRSESGDRGLGWAVRWGVALLVPVMVVAVWAGYRVWNGPASTPAAAADWEIPSRYDADRVDGYLADIVGFGPRPSGSAAMEQQQGYLVDFFEGQGAEVIRQSFDTRHPETGERITMTNLIARFRADAPQRYLICAHYDTRPYPDQDPVNPRGVFVGANDGASGAAALMEFSHHIELLPATIGLDLVLFDGEELVYDPDRDDYFLGSTHFAESYVATARRGDADFVPYRAGVLLDMIGDRELHLYYERNSWNYAREITVEIWSKARRLGIDAFKPRIRHIVRDDHLPLNQIARIPTTDLIDFDYPRPGLRHQSYWHTTEDSLDKVSGHSVVAVIYVLIEWLSSKA